MRVSKSKRLWFSISIIIINFLMIIGGIIHNIDLVALGTSLTMINTPLYVYVLGESFRPSAKINKTDE